MTPKLHPTPFFHPLLQTQCHPAFGWVRESLASSVWPTAWTYGEPRSSPSPEGGGGAPGVKEAQGVEGQSLSSLQ